MKKEEQANLGLATTKELLQELIARSEVQGEGGADSDLKITASYFVDSCSEAFLNYRTVDV